MKLDLKSCSRLPTLPTVAVRILETFENPETPIDNIVNIIQSDPAIAGKVLRAANSAQYGSVTRVANLKRAVLMLGKRAVTPLVLSFCLAQESMENGRTTAYYQEFWMNAFVRSTAADLLSDSSSTLRQTGEASTVSLLSAIGRLALLRYHTDPCTACIDTARAEGRTVSDVERETWGFSHVELSASILRELRLADYVVAAVGMQLEAAETIAALPPSKGRELALMVAAARSAAQYMLEPNPALSLVRLEECLDALGPPWRGTSDELVRNIVQRMEASKGIFEIEMARLPCPQVLLEQALDQLAEIATVVVADPGSERVPAQLLEENGRLKRRVADLIRQATIDPLTGIYNRSHLMHVCREFVALSKLRRQPMGILAVDVDHFKWVNDTFGHLAGDVVLGKVAETLRQAIREQDVVGRYGGEEFVALVLNATRQCLESVGERMRAAVEALEIVVEGDRIPVTISIGGACAIPADDQEGFAERLYLCADRAMYQAKQTGRNRCIVADPEAGSPRSAACPIGEANSVPLQHE